MNGQLVAAVVLVLLLVMLYGSYTATPALNTASASQVAITTAAGPSNDSSSSGIAPLGVPAEAVSNAAPVSAAAPKSWGHAAPAPTTNKMLSDIAHDNAHMVKNLFKYH